MSSNALIRGYAFPKYGPAMGRKTAAMEAMKPGALNKSTQPVLMALAVRTAGTRQAVTSAHVVRDMRWIIPLEPARLNTPQLS